jgi:hypothetical protein
MNRLFSNPTYRYTLVSAAGALNERGECGKGATLTGGCETLGALLEQAT